MKKIYLFMLMAVGLLISGNAGAQGTNNVRLTYGSFQQDYNSLQTAFDNLPQNSTPATVTLLDDVQIEFEKGYYVRVAKYQNVTIDLMGNNIYAAQSKSNSSCVIENYGTLTIVDNSTDKLGVISNTSEDPDDASSPSRANNVINNYGTLILKSGTIINNTSDPDAAACYAIDQSTNGADASFIMEGGELKQPYNDCVRLRASSETYNNSAIIKGGKITAGGTCLWIQGGGGATKAPKAEITIIDGTLISTSKPRYITSWTWWWPYCGPNVIQTSTACLRTNYVITVSGGTLYGCVDTGYRGEEFRKGKENQAVPLGLENVSISGGTFYNSVIDEQIYTNPGFQNAASVELWATITEEHEEGFITGGVFPDTPSDISTDPGYYVVDFFNNKYTTVGWEHYIAKGYTKEFEFKKDGVDYYRVVPVKQENLDVNGGEINLSEQGKTLDETTDLTITPNVGENTIINIDEDTKVNKIEVTAPYCKGEAQIVVKNGVTLDVGNGGLVSENNELITVLVETGGTLIIGTGGVDKIGEATPIKIQAGEEKGSGSLIFSPNATTAATQKYAEVDLYTYCKKVGEKYYWQQFAIPVTGLANDKVAKNPDETSYVFEWDYATYAWSQLSNWDQLDEPFAGYDMTNLSTTGGVVYTFKGDLIGNQNKQLTLPHKDYCVMGNSYTAPIDINALFDQINKEMSENTIEKTVYKYDAKAGYYVYTNELEQALDKMGVVKASFTEIKPMEGFLLNLQNGNTAGVMLNYANAVYTPAMTPNTPATAPRMANTDIVLAKINVKSAHAMDQMTLVESDEFSAEIENGKDAFKYLNEGANLYAFDGTNKLAMVATDNLENTMLAFQAAEDEEYTLTFDRALNADYILMDMLTGEKVAMVEGNTYTFTATPNTLNPGRFMIVATAKAPTDMVNTKANKAVKGVYTIMGQYLGNGEMWNELPQGVYMVNGVKVIK